MGIQFVIVISALFAACGQVPDRRSIEDKGLVSQRVSTPTEGPFHSLTGWTETVSFYIDDRIPGHLIDSAIAASQSWNDVLGRQVLDFVGVARVSRGNELYSSLDDSLTMIYYENNWKESTGKSVSTLATTVWENALGSDRIIKGDILLNAEAYSFCDALSSEALTLPVERIVDAQSVILHEFGHLLGLDHVDSNSDPDSIMHAKTYIGPNMSFRNLSTGDVANIHSVYK